MGRTVCLIVTHDREEAQAVRSRHPGSAVFEKAGFYYVEKPIPDGVRHREGSNVDQVIENGGPPITPPVELPPGLAAVVDGLKLNKAGDDEEEQDDGGIFGG